MIEKTFVAQKTKEHYIKAFVEETLPNVGISDIRLKKIPLGEKIIITTSRPSLVVGSKGANIKTLTKQLKQKFKLENPQVEINEVKQFFLDANIVADRIANSLERFGSARFKSIGHKMMEAVAQAGAMGVEISLSGKIPGARARSWRFYQGYLKKCGDISIVGVRKAKRAALLKSGIIGIKVSIMPPDLVLPDHIKLLEEQVQVVEEVADKANDAKEPELKKDVEDAGADKPAKSEKSDVGKAAEKEATKENVKEALGEGAKSEQAEVRQVAEEQATEEAVEEIVEGTPTEKESAAKEVVEK